MNEQPHLIMGVDPGLTGAIAILKPGINGQRATVLKVHDMPLTELRVNKQVRRSLDVYELSNIVGEFAKEIKFAVVEQVSSMPEQGVASTFKFGTVYGMALGSIGANMIPIFQIKPAVWKMKLGLNSVKHNSRLMASRLYPEIEAQLSRAMDDGRAEAILLAHYGMEMQREIDRK